MNCYGRVFLESSVGSSIRRLCSDNVVIEVDPARGKNKSSKEIERGVEELVRWCQIFWDQIYVVRNECPEFVFLSFQQLF